MPPTNRSWQCFGAIFTGTRAPHIFRDEVKGRGCHRSGSPGLPGTPKRGEAEAEPKSAAVCRWAFTSGGSPPFAPGLNGVVRCWGLGCSSYALKAHTTAGRPPFHRLFRSLPSMTPHRLTTCWTASCQADAEATPRTTTERHFWRSTRAGATPSGGSCGAVAEKIDAGRAESRGGLRMGTC
jgi:hypothetical protein